MADKGFAVKSEAAEGEPQKGLIVLERKNKRKRRYSKRLKGIGRGERYIVKAGHRIVEAMSSGIKEYRNRSDKSAEKKKDGSLRDLLKNAILGASKAMSKAAKAPADLVKIIK